MRRNVRNVTLVGFAALVLGGVAVAASGAFDSTPTDSVARESATGDAVAGAPTTIAAFSNDAKVESVAAGGAASGAATDRCRPRTSATGGRRVRRRDPGAGGRRRQDRRRPRT